jgi:hypothetical protein
MYAPYPGRSLARQENLFFGKITEGLFIHWMIKKKLENFPESLCWLPEQSIPKLVLFMYTKSNRPGFFIPLHELTSAASSPQTYSVPRDFGWGCMNGPAINRTGKKFSPWILAISATDGLAQAIHVTPCCDPNHAFLPAFRTFQRELYDLRRSILHKRSRNTARSSGNMLPQARKYPTLFGSLFLSGD